MGDIFQGDKGILESHSDKGKHPRAWLSRGPRGGSLWLVFWGARVAGGEAGVWGTVQFLGGPTLAEDLGTFLEKLGNLRRILSSREPRSDPHHRKLTQAAARIDGRCMQQAQNTQP